DLPPPEGRISLGGAPHRSAHATERARVGSDHPHHLELVVDGNFVMREVTVRAPAKINLGLEVLGKRPDGYHELLTVLQTINLADTVRIRLTERSSILRTDRASIGLTVRFSGTDEVDLGPAEQNLVLRA